jgi:hypothetical protein
MIIISITFILFFNKRFQVSQLYVKYDIYLPINT